MERSIGDILSNRSRGVLPRKFCAFWPKPQGLQKETNRVYQVGPHSGFATWNSARVALLRCPVLRPGENIMTSALVSGNTENHSSAGSHKTGSVWSDGC